MNTNEHKFYIFFKQRVLLHSVSVTTNLILYVTDVVVVHSMFKRRPVLPVVIQLLRLDLSTGLLSLREELPPVPVE